MDNWTLSCNSWAIFLGGFAQLFACINNSKRNNVFGGYALFWFGVATSWLIKLGVFGEALAKATDSRQLGFAFLGYLIFSLFMTLGSMETNKVLFIIFVLIDILLIGLSLSSFEILGGRANESFFVDVAPAAKPSTGWFRLRSK